MNIRSKEIRKEIINIINTMKGHSAYSTYYYKFGKQFL